MDAESSVRSGWLRGHRILQLAACALAAITSAILLFAPTYSQEWTSGSGGGSDTASLVQVNGWSVLIPLLIPVLTAALPLVGRQPRAHLLISVVATILIAGFVLIMGLSVGLFYLPVLLCELVGLGMLGQAATRPGPARPQCAK